MTKEEIAERIVEECEQIIEKYLDRYPNVTWEEVKQVIDDGIPPLRAKLIDLNAQIGVLELKKALGMKK